MATPSFETVSRCFFVYAPITELGRDLPHQSLFHFGQPRIGWAAGYVQANQNNAVFKQVFESNLEKNKRAAVKLETMLRRAIQSKDQGQFQRAINQAVDCDRALGIRTSDLPNM
ncbi:hypothetical protein J7U46_16790 [Pelomonas sp. V22]|uniref:hypothetical protein n=1 Tax=Pelomonas sp. V22 TaxID=2822139 RepID=UPI0024A81F5A|nr:hypothetical protein [Pelomonas sp. V22]MDI4634720.1 hypothetical protein [Pelomonas sp. V22]